MKYRGMFFAAALAVSMQLPVPANATVCSYDWKPGGGDAVVNWLTGVRVAKPSAVKLDYFGGWTEIIIYDLSQSQILYQGAPIPSYNAADGITILAYKVTPGAVLRITTDWSSPPAGCT